VKTSGTGVVGHIETLRSTTAAFDHAAACRFSVCHKSFCDKNRHGLGWLPRGTCVRNSTAAC